MRDDEEFDDPYSAGGLDPEPPIYRFATPRSVTEVMIHSETDSWLQVWDRRNQNRLSFLIRDFGDWLIQRIEELAQYRNLVGQTYDEAVAYVHNLQRDKLRLENELDHLRARNLPSMYGCPVHDRKHQDTIRRGLKYRGVDFYEIPYRGGGVAFLMLSGQVAKLTVWNASRASNRAYMPVEAEHRHLYEIVEMDALTLARLADAKPRRRI